MRGLLGLVLVPGLLVDSHMIASGTGALPRSTARHDAPFHDEGYGYDVFGLHPPAVIRALRAAMPWYRHYFRVRSHGIERVPRRGGAIVVANHSGLLPIDGLMLWVDVVHQTGRYLRIIADRFIPALPFVSTTFARTGVVSGTHANVRRLLERDELIAIFPEGVSGPAKAHAERYQLQEWRVGHVELAIRYRVPIIPLAIVGAEESWPLWRRLPLRLFGAPYLPIPTSPLPLPFPFDLHYGAPIALHERYDGDAADDPAQLAAAAAETRTAVSTLLEAGRAERRWR